MSPTGSRFCPACPPASASRVRCALEQRERIAAAAGPSRLPCGVLETRNSRGCTKAVAGLVCLVLDLALELVWAAGLSRLPACHDAVTRAHTQTAESYPFCLRVMTRSCARACAPPCLRARARARTHTNPAVLMEAAVWPRYIKLTAVRVGHT